MENSSDFLDRMTSRRAKRHKKQKRSWIIKGILSVAALYLVFSVIFSFRSSMTTAIALKGTIEEEILADGYVFRDQKVMIAPASGYLEAWVSEGDRVREGQSLGCIYTGEYDPERSQKIQELNRQISQLEHGTPEATYSGNSVMAEQKIASAVRDMSDLRTEHDISNLTEGKENLNLLIARKRNTESGTAEDKDAALTALKSQLKELENATEGGKHELTAPGAGVFYSRIDGMEDKLSLAALDQVSVSYLKELDKIPLTRSSDVVQNEPVGKVVNNYGWYFSANVDAKDAERLKVGQSIRMRFFDLSDTTVYGTVRTLSGEEDGKVAVTIYTNRYVEGIYAASRTSAELVLVRSEGIKVPVQSLHMQDNQTGVYVLRLGVARFVPVQVRYKNSDWAIIGAVTDTGAEYKLQIYDEVVVESKNLEDGKVVR